MQQQVSCLYETLHIDDWEEYSYLKWFKHNIFCPGLGQYTPRYTYIPTRTHRKNEMSILQ